MRTFERKQHKPQKKVSSDIAQPNKATPAPVHHEHPILRLQRTIGNQAVQRMLQSDGAPADVDQAINSPGKPLEPEIRQDMEQRFDHDFSEVRVHTDAKAAESARGVNALAYTVGHDVVFSEGGYTPQSRQGAQVLAHELAHVVQQERGGTSQPSWSGDTIEQAADAAGSAFVAGQESIHVSGASAPGLARQPLPGTEPVNRTKPRSLDGSLSKDEQSLNDAALELEIELIQNWLNLNPRASESEYLRSELKDFYIESLRRAQQREAMGQGPKEGTMAKLSSIAHQGVRAHMAGLWPNYKFLSKGTMEWRLGEQRENDNFWSRRIEVRFTPNPSYAFKKITFLQTVHQVYPDGRDYEKKKIDTRPGEFRPFYGMDWEPRKKEWIPEVTGPPQGFKNQPSSSADHAAYLWDEPVTRNPVTKLFETVAVVPETGEPLGALQWGVGQKAPTVACDDRATSGFLVTLDKFYAPRAELPEDQKHEATFDVILDGFGANDATLTANQQKQLDSLAATAKDRSNCVVVGGFGDAMDRDPMGASEQRAQAVASYLMSKGVQKEYITMTGFGATWARFHPSTNQGRQGRNRRVQIRLRSRDNTQETCDTYPITGAFEVFK
jgi:outer membrane protein OmpA-like peptidoglycan-associated protein